ncbi:hypothetical protein JTE90_008742 [Oedothorax gibbosus]|uniref:Uncharacterized protein n=1 Tax=Oedothorax gibbosus TaxID=931172 RepID=A0AAV6UPX1_9ARAC|nr:hypothetical protein JTE90_008742 [Oedothorax gibbosus]
MFHDVMHSPKQHCHYHANLQQTAIAHQTLYVRSRGTLDELSLEFLLLVSTSFTVVPLDAGGVRLGNVRLFQARRRRTLTIKTGSPADA